MSNKRFEDIIAEQGQLIYTNVGDSMYPLIQPRDLLVIRKPEKPLKRYDIPLYKRDNGQYVLHRILKVRKNDYVICGDNRSGVEYGITDRHIIGILTAIIRDGQTIPVETPKNSLFYRSILFRKVFFKLRKRRRTPKSG